MKKDTYISVEGRPNKHSFQSVKQNETRYYDSSLVNRGYFLSSFGSMSQFVLVTSRTGAVYVIKDNKPEKQSVLLMWSGIVYVIIDNNR